jgi:uncharacterized protein (DUF3084 family)
VGEWAQIIVSILGGLVTLAFTAGYLRSRLEGSAKDLEKLEREVEVWISELERNVETRVNAVREKLHELSNSVQNDRLKASQMLAEIRREFVTQQQFETFARDWKEESREIKSDVKTLIEMVAHISARHEKAPS